MYYLTISCFSFLFFSFRLHSAAFIISAFDLFNFFAPQPASYRHAAYEHPVGLRTCYDTNLLPALPLRFHALFVARLPACLPASLTWPLRLDLPTCYFRRNGGPSTPAPKRPTLALSASTPSAETCATGTWIQTRHAGNANGHTHTQHTKCTHAPH